MKKSLAQLKCMSCGMVWEQEPDPTNCQTCGHLYVAWTNYLSTYGSKEK